MEKHLFISCFIMFMLSISILTIMFFKRLRDMRVGVTDPKYFKTYDLATTIPTRTAQTVRNYSNLFETPILFYAIIALILALDLQHLHLVYLAYAYAGSRVLHSIVHLTTNKLYPRMITFMSSVFILFLLWSRTLLLIG